MTETLVDMLKDSTEKLGARPALLFKPGLRYFIWTYSQLWEEAGLVHLYSSIAASSREIEQ